MRDSSGRISAQEVEFCPKFLSQRLLLQENISLQLQESPLHLSVLKFPKLRALLKQEVPAILPHYRDQGCSHGVVQQPTASVSLSPYRTRNDLHCTQFLHSSGSSVPAGQGRVATASALHDQAPRSPHGHIWPHLAIHSTAGGSQFDKSSGEGGCCPLNQGIRDLNTRC